MYNLVYCKYHEVLSEATLYESRTLVKSKVTSYYEKYSTCITLRII